MGGAQAGEGHQRGRGAHRGCLCQNGRRWTRRPRGGLQASCLDSSVGPKVSSKVLGKCWAWASPWAWAMAVAADTTLQLGLRRLDRAAEKVGLLKCGLPMGARSATL